MPPVLCAQEFQVTPDVQYQRFEAATTSFVIDGVTPVHSVEQSKWYMMGSPGWETKFSFRSVDDIIKVGIDPKVKAIVGNYKYRITLSVKGYVANNPSPQAAIPVVFTLEYNKDSLQTYKDLSAIKLPNVAYHKMDVAIADITDLNNPSQPSLNVSQVAKNFFIESSIAVQRYDTDHFRFVTGSAYDAMKNSLNVGWYHYLGAQNTNCYFGVAYENFMPAKYELEWTYVDDYQYNLSAKTGSYKNSGSQFTVNYNFKNNATRIQTNNLTYAIPLIYEHGAIVFRVRAVRPSETNYNLMVYEDWTLPDAGTLTDGSFSSNNFQEVYNCPNRCLYLINNPFEDDKFDWQYSINFAEEGKYKHVLNYFDGAGHKRQTLTKLNSDNDYIIGTDHIYDYEGRAAIQLLPTPIESQNLGFKPDLSLKSGSSSPFSAVDFDYGCYTHSIPTLGSNSLAGMYYSSSNPHQEGMQKYVPDAEGYPFIETIYSPDYTDKVLFQGGAGEKFQIGNQHVTSNTYVRADQYEINRLFGTQVGRSEYYPKVITKDPNNQLSLSIFNQSGKVIATALAGASPDSSLAPILPLNSVGAAASSTTNILANLTQSTSDGLRSVNYSFFPEAAGTNSFLYHGAIRPYPTGCSGKFINVQGFYNIKVVNDCGDLKFPSNVGNANIQYPVGVSSITTSNASQYFPGTSSGTLSLNPEKYTFIKELYFPDTTLHRLANQFTESNSGFGLCYDYQDNFIRRSIEAASFPCKTEEPASPCDQLRAQMKAELYPGAKYGKYTKSQDGKFLAGADNSIFTTIDIGGSTNTNSSDCYYIRTCFVTGYNVEPPGGTGGGGDGDPGTPVQAFVTDTVWGPNYITPPMHAGFYGGCENSDTMCSDYKYRYQLDCVHLPDVHISVTIGGTVLDQNIGSGSNVSPDNLIGHFTDAMADSLLPFHPEYCKLLLCDDHLEDILNKITCYQDARALGLTTLQQIFDQDPLHQSSINPNGLTFAQLSRFAIGDPTGTQPSISSTYLVQRLDSLAREKAWCGCDALETYAYCRNSEYKYDIKYADIETADTQIQNAYIKNLIAFYIGNRTIRRQRMMDGPLGDCSPCEENVMELIAPPVFATFFNGNNVSSSFGLPADIQNAFNQALNGNNPGLPNSLGGSNGSMATDNSENIRQQVKVIMTSLQNCGLTYTDSSNLSNYLSTGVIPGVNGTGITPAIVKARLEFMGYNINNLCNSFLAKYNIYDTKQNRVASNFVNKKAEFYTGLQSFLAETGLKTALNTASATGGTAASITLISSNAFEAELAAVLQASASGTITATCYLKTINDPAALPADNNGSTSRTVYAVVLANGSYNDTLYLAKRKNVTQSDCNNSVTYTIPGGTYYADVSIIGAGYLSTFSFSNVRSVLSDPATLALSDGYIADNLAYANLSGIAGPYGQSGCDNFVIWSHKLSMLKPKNPDAVDDCINCVQIKNAVADYISDAAAQGMPLFANHPNFKVDLSNYLNTKLKQHHSYFEYERLMKGCALSNFLRFKKSIGQYHRTFTQSADLYSFVNGVNAAIGDGNVDYVAYLDGGGYQLWVDLNTVPADKYRTVALLMPFGTTEGFDNDLIADVLIPNNNCGGSTPQFPALPSGTVIGSGNSISLRNVNGNFDLPYTLYHMTGAGSMTESDIADAIGAIKAYCETSCPGTVYLEARKVMRSEDYGSTAKTNYLAYIYSLETAGQSQGEISDNIAPSVIKASVSPFTGSVQVSYNEPWCAGNKGDLYYAAAPTSLDPGWVRLQGIINTVSSSSGLGANKLFPSTDITTIAPGGLGSSLKVIKMANGTAWYRLFDNQNKMFNVYIVPAANMQGSLNSYTIAGPIEPVIGPDSVYTFKIKLENSSLLTTPVPHVVTCYGYTNFGLQHSEMVKDVVLSNEVSDNCLDTLPCERITALNAIQQGKMLYAAYIDSIKDFQYFAMKDFFPLNTVDTLDFTTQKQQYQYTLYNYDLVGNLTSTVPPDGVKPITNSTTLSGIDNARTQNSPSSTYWPSHTKKSVYVYNTYNQLISQTTPDGGLTTFYYNRAGQLSFSQNAKQKLSNRFSYTLYDGQGRIDETGVITLLSTGANIVQLCPGLSAVAIADQVRGMVREDVVATFYDEALLSLATNPGLSTQENLRKRVSSILYIQQLALGNSAESYYNYATHFSYDALGNVKTLVQDNPYMDYLGQRFKRVDYDYDLLSGKVNMVSYNRGKADQFYQRYAYDADNRITIAESSNDGLIWDRDASYTYYKHGPLAQMSIGDYNVQSLQYAYTIQGWLKAINGDVLDSTADMGNDGIAGSAFPSDVVAHSLEYFDSDYKSISNTPVTYASGGASLKNLYNGNISRQTTGMNSIGTLQRTYQYDQLNRIRSAYYNTVMDLSHEVIAMANGTSAFSNSYTYDADGNILTLNRYNGDNLVLDRLIYSYPDTTLNNKLISVAEAAGGSAVGGGIPPNQPAINYSYDKIGNLAKDVQGGLDSIYWNAYGKVRDIKINGDNKHLYYSYDGTGNRIRKDFVEMSGTDGIRTSDVYVRDASGNILAVYKGKSKISGGLTIEWVNNDIITHHEGTWVTSSGYGVLPFLIQQYGNNGQFTNPLLDIAQVQFPSWSTAQSNSLGLQQYLVLSDGIYSLLVHSNISSYYGPLLSSESVNHTSIITSSLAADLGVRNYFTPVLAELVVQDAKETVTVTQARVARILTSMQSIAPLSFAQVMKDMGVKVSRPTDDVNNLTTKIVTQHQAMQFMGSFTGLTSSASLADELLQFSGKTIKDSTLMYSAWISGHQTTSGAIANMVRATQQRGDASSFFAGWLSNTNPNWLTNNTTLKDRLNVVMQADQTTFMASYLDNIGMAPVNQTLATIVSLNGYLQSVWEGVTHGTLNPTYTPPDVTTPDPGGLAGDTLYLAEHHLYGSSRLGIKTYLPNEYRVVYKGPPNPGSQGTILENGLNEQTPWYSLGMADWIKKDKAETYSGSTYNAVTDVVSETRTLGTKQYELTDHLGNVLSTVVDRKTGYGDSLSTITGLHYYRGYYANLASVTDYYPGGMEMPGRIKTFSSYRFGNQKQEEDDEIYGEGNVSAFKYRFEDTRLNRFFSVDPLSKKYPWNSSYAFSENRLIDGHDLEGGEFEWGMLEQAEKSIFGTTHLKQAREGFVNGFVGRGTELVNGVVDMIKNPPLMATIDPSIAKRNWENTMRNAQANYNRTMAVMKGDPQAIGSLVFDMALFYGTEGIAAARALSLEVKSVSIESKEILQEIKTLTKETNTLSKSQLKSISSYENLIKEHEAKLIEVITDPIKADHLGKLKNVSWEVRQKIIKNRIDHLRKEINAFKLNIQKIKDNPPPQK